MSSRSKLRASGLPFWFSSTGEGEGGKKRSVVPLGTTTTPNASVQVEVTCFPFFFILCFFSISFSYYQVVIIQENAAKHVFSASRVDSEGSNVSELTPIKRRF